MPLNYALPVMLYGDDDGRVWADQPATNSWAWISQPMSEQAASSTNDFAVVGSRSEHKHPVYGDGQYGQQPVARMPHRSPPHQRCKDHAWFDAEGMPFPTPHSHGLQLHDANIVEMNENLLQSIEDTFDMASPMRLGGGWKQLHAKISSSSHAFIWYQMKTKAGYRGFMAKCKCCGSMAWATKAPHSTTGFVDLEIATLATFFKVEVPEHMTRPVEKRAPMECQREFFRYLDSQPTP